MLKLKLRVPGPGESDGGAPNCEFVFENELMSRRILGGVHQQIQQILHEFNMSTSLIEHLSFLHSKSK